MCDVLSVIDNPIKFTSIVNGIIIFDVSAC